MDSAFYLELKIEKPSSDVCQIVFWNCGRRLVNFVRNAKNARRARARPRKERQAETRKKERIKVRKISQNPIFCKKIAMKISLFFGIWQFFSGVTPNVFVRDDVSSL